MVKEILPLIPKHRVYIESHFGGGAILFAKPKSEAEVINDINAMVVNYYQVVKSSDFKKLKEKIEGTAFSRATYNVALAIYRMPHLFNDPVVLAWAFYVGTQMGFSCQIGSWGYDKYNKRVKAFRNKKLRFSEGVAARIDDVQIEHIDALKLIKNRDGNDVFFYVDPPYPNSNQGHYSGFSQQDFEDLLIVLSTVKAKFLLSSYPNSTLEKYTKKFGWSTKTFDKPLSARKAKDNKPRGRKTEVLTANYSLREIQQ